MINKNNRNNKYTNNQKVIFAVLSVLLILIIIPVSKNFSRRHKINTEIQNIEKEIEANEKKNSDLQKLIKYLDSQQFTEEQARLNLGFKKEGEEVVIVKNNETPKQEKAENKEITTNSIFSVPNINKNEKKTASNAIKWWSYFLK